MLISIDIARVNNHISLLEQEYREAQALEKALALWRTQALADGLTDDAFLVRHLRAIIDQQEFIRKRISWLNHLVDDFSTLKLQTAELLDDATHAAAAALSWQ